MKALVLREDAIGVEDIKGPEKPKGISGPFTTVSVLCAALNHRDQYIREGLYSNIQLPAILGSDVSGHIVSSDGAVQTDELYVIDPTFEWGDDDKAQSKDMRILGMPMNGGFAEKVIVPIDHLHPAPHHLTAEEAAAIPVAGVTAWRALMHQGRCSKNDTVFVTGAGGGVATLAIQFALTVGCKVITSSRSKTKLEQLVVNENVASDRLTTVVMDEDGDWVKTVKGLKPTLIIDSIGGEIVNHLLDVLMPGGTLVFYGASAGHAPSLNLHRVFWKQLTLRGSTMGTEDDFADMLSFVDKERIRPIIDRIYPLEDAVDAFQRMKDGKQLGKIVFRVAE